MNIINNIISKIKYDSEMKEDIYKIGTMLIVSKAFKDRHIKNLDDKKFWKETFITLFGFAFYHLFVKDLASKIPIQDANLYNIALIVIKVSTVLFVPKILQGKELDVYRGSFIISGFIANFLLKDIIDLDSYFMDPRFKQIADDFVKAMFTTLIPIVVKGGKINKKALYEVVAKTIGFAFYDLFLA